MLLHGEPRGSRGEALCLLFVPGLPVGVATAIEKFRWRDFDNGEGFQDEGEKLDQSWG